MITLVKVPLVIASIYLWIGFVAAISFMEAWLKFKAKGVTLQIGLGIGRLVFHALNKVEWLFAIGVFAGLLISNHNVLTTTNTLFYIPLVLLIAQTIVLLPALDFRAESRIHGLEIPPSNLHIYYVIMEIIKVGCLFTYGIIQLNCFNN